VQQALNLVVLADVVGWCRWSWGKRHPGERSRDSEEDVIGGDPKHGPRAHVDVVDIGTSRREMECHERNDWRSSGDSWRGSDINLDLIFFGVHHE
jgi:hypothetical protein